MGKMPAFQLYPGDWLRDAVAGCSLEAQGLWLRMMFLMHDSERYGYLVMNGSAIPSESIARRCGCTLAQYETLLAELDAAGVTRRTKEGVIFCLDLVEAAQSRAQAVERKRKERRSDPKSATAEKRVSRSCHTDVTPDVTPMSHASSSSSSSSTSREDSERGRPLSAADAAAENSPDAINPDPADVIWKAGVELLVSRGTSNPQSRAYLGALAKEFGKEKLAQAIGVALLNSPVDPKAYLRAACVGQKPTYQRELSQAEINKAAPGKFVC